MKYLEYLYYQYYRFQVRMGNTDIAPFSSMLIIAFTFMLYYFSIFFWFILFLPNWFLDMRLFKYMSIFLFFLLIILLYLLLVNKGKYKNIIKKNEERYERKRSLGAILFPLIAFILFNLGWILKMMQNQGKF